jgi:hypothetical protein
MKTTKSWLEAFATALAVIGCTVAFSWCQVQTEREGTKRFEIEHTK